MNYLETPLSIFSKGLKRTATLRDSVDQHVRLILTTPLGSCVPDPQLGFVFNNLRFENIDENEGVVQGLSQDSDEEEHYLYGLKLSGSSKNLNTFASEVKSQIERYEKRLQDVNVNMTYVREKRIIYITIKAQLIATKENYLYTSQIKVWN